jgi:phenylacetate-coenzyme A ligase PaaK-like adenylate-forming protein
MNRESDGMLKKENALFSIGSEQDFLEQTLAVFQHQYTSTEIYRRWVDLLRVDASKVSAIEEIPFLPIEFFKKFKIADSQINPNTLFFKSSATTSQTPAQHYVTDVEVYKRSFLLAFEREYGAVNDYCILALLPSYLQRGGSSLVYMFDELITRSNHPYSGFFLNNVDELIAIIKSLNNTKQKVLLIGVSYALMDLCDKGIHLGENFILMETGGMKGTRKELLKEELHAYLKKGFHIKNVQSEYGMTELLSQAYSKKDGLFKSPPWLKFLVREVDDPLKLRHDNKTGGINVIDLANLHSCSFIATKDLGRITKEGYLELMGRYDHSDVRGCNLMMGDF